MRDLTFPDIEEHLHNAYPDLSITKINPDDLIFEEKVKLNCFYCGRYNTNWKCPPRIPKDIDYEKLVREFNNAAFIYGIFQFTKQDYADIRTESSLVVHKSILELEQFLFQNGNSTSISFIGGSCKLCKNGCGKDRCSNPYLARIPLEAIGVNVVKSAEKYNVAIEFPVTDHITRLGLILW